MTPRRSLAPAAPNLAWFSMWMKSCEIAWISPMVIGARLSQMALGGWPPNIRDQKELARMAEEKASAFWEVSSALMKAWPTMSATSMDRALSPVHRRVVANNRRLRKA